MNPGWNQQNQGQTPPQGWGNQNPPPGLAGQQNWSDWNNPNQLGYQNNQASSTGWGNPGFIIPTSQQANTNSWSQHSGWGIQLQKNQPTQPYQPLLQQVLQQPKQSPYQQQYLQQYTPIAKNIETTPSNQQSTQNSLKLDLSKEYIICTALDNTMVADVNKDGKNKNQLMLWKKHGESNQRYKLVPVNDRFMIISMDSNFALEIQNSSPTKGALIVASQQTGSPSQLWQLVQSKQSDGGFFIRTFCGKCWDLCEWKTSQGAPIIQYDFNGGRNQVWQLKPF